MNYEYTYLINIQYIYINPPYIITPVTKRVAMNNEQNERFEKVLFC